MVGGAGLVVRGEVRLGVAVEGELADLPPSAVLSVDVDGHAGTGSVGGLGSEAMSDSRHGRESGRRRQASGLPDT